MTLTIRRLRLPVKAERVSGLRTGQIFRAVNYAGASLSDSYYMLVKMDAGSDIYVDLSTGHGRVASDSFVEYGVRVAAVMTVEDEK